MSSSNDFGRDPAPSAIRYLMLLSALVSALTALSFLPRAVGASTNEADFYQVAIPIFFNFSVVSVIEWYVLGKSRKMTGRLVFGPYGFALLVEIIKTIALAIGLNQYLISVEGASSGDFLLLQLNTLAIIVGLGATKFLRTKIDEIAKRDISRHALNLLPTLLVLLLFMGFTFAEIAGLNTPRQRRDFENYTEKTIDWSMFNTPTWDATYLLENLLDQFTAGLSAPDVILFNVTSDQPDTTTPPVYWRLSNLDSYEYTDKPPYTTDWNPSDFTKRALSPIPSTPNSTYSHIIPSGDRTARFTLEMPLDHNSTTVDISVHPSFTNVIPTVWNGVYGSYVSSNSFELYDGNGSQLIPVSSTAREIFPTLFANDLAGINANIQVAETSTESGLFKYTMDYKTPDIQTAAAFSLGRSDDIYEQILTESVWNTIKDLYLQIPTVLPQGFSTYIDWAPTVYATALAWNDSLQTVFGQAYANMLKCENWTFDETMWLGEQLAGQAMDHPAEYEDYNEWFLTHDEDVGPKGVSLHFASTYAMINRLQRIPTRVVIGYLAGNDSYVYGGKRAVSSRFLHAWTEVLVPIDPNPILPGDERVEWHSFDPLISYLADQYGYDLPSDIIPQGTDELTTFIRPDYDLETKGLALAYAEQGAGQWIFGRAVLNGSGLLPEPYTLHHGNSINLSARLISTPSAATWMPVQGQNVTFWLGTDAENITGDIETTGIPLGSGITNLKGVATLSSFQVDIAILGIRTARFYAVAHIGTPAVRRLAITLEYDITF